MVDRAADRPRLEAGFRVGVFHAEPQRMRIVNLDTGLETRVEPKVMDVLVHLAEHAGSTVAKKQFMGTVWDATIVTDDALLRCISELRKIFGDDPRDPRYIETIRKKGYRLIAPVGFDDAATDPSSPPDSVLVGGTPGPAAPLGHANREADAASSTRPTTGPEERSEIRPTTMLPRLGWSVAGLVAAATAFVLLQGTFRPSPPALLRAVPLTSYPGVESDPMLSPDGSRLAFVRDAGDGGGFDLFIKQIGEETPLRLTSHPADDGSPAWSPDGLYLAFVRTSDEENELYVIPAVGGAERRVARLGARGLRRVAWSPDGRTLAFTAERVPHGPFGIFLLSIDTLDERLLTEPPGDYRGDLEVAFSPDSRRIAFTRSIVEKVDDLFIVSTSGGELKRLTFEHAEITGLTWTPDGRHVVYTSDREGSPALWRVAASGGPSTWLPTTSEGSGIHQPSAMRHGRRLAFVHRLQETNVWAHRLGPDPSAPRRLIASTRWDSHPALSPDGRRLAFASNRSGSFEIWTADRDGANPIQLTRFGGPFTNTPRWSPDGTRLAFVARGEGSVDLYTIGGTGGDPRRLTTAASNEAAPGWSRDGTWIYFASNRSGSWQVWKIEAAGGAPPVQVTYEGGYAALESTDGASLFFTRRDAPGLWRMPLDGGPAVALPIPLTPYDWGNWTVAPDGIFFVDRSGPESTLSFHAFDTGATRSLLPLERLPRHPAIALSADATYVLATRIDRLESDIWLTDDFE